MSDLFEDAIENGKGLKPIGCTDKNKKIKLDDGQESLEKKSHDKKKRQGIVCVRRQYRSFDVRKDKENGRRGNLN